jgi:hypothetical protein
MAASPGCGRRPIEGGDRADTRDPRRDGVHVNRDGETASGRCESRIEVLDDGRLRLHERWHWESRTGSGTAAVEEVPA